MEKLEVLETRTILGKEFDIYGTYEEPLFLAKDVAKWIGVQNTSELVKEAELEDEEYTKKIIDIEYFYGNEITPRTRRQEVILVTEEGLYEILFVSNKPKAKKFKKEVKAILKEIRLNNGYVIPGKEQEFIAKLQKDIYVLEDSYQNGKATPLYVLSREFGFGPVHNLRNLLINRGVIELQEVYGEMVDGITPAFQQLWLDDYIVYYHYRHEDEHHRYMYWTPKGKAWLSKKLKNEWRRHLIGKDKTI